MAAIMAVLRLCMESFKSILTSQEFGSEYELLCTELSTQWLRIRLWGESVGLHINDAGHLQNSLFERPDIESTVTQCIQSIAYLLTELEVLRRKYELRPALLPSGKTDEKSIRACKSLSTLSDIKSPASSLRQRMRDNQKQTSFLALTKWALCDAKKFDEKVKRLKGLVDGLEDISRAAGIACSQPANRISSTPLTTSAEEPPPYSAAAPSRQESRSEPAAITPTTTPSLTLDPGILVQHVALKQFIGLSSYAAVNPSSGRARTKLMSLSNSQFKELRIDVYDEMVRRKHDAVTTPSLPHVEAYHPKRNQARRKLSGLTVQRFKDLTTDVVHELERRFTSLQMQVIYELERVVQVPDVPRSPRRHSHRRYGCVDPQVAPPLLRHRASHPASFSRPFGATSSPLIITTSKTTTATTSSPPTSRYSSSAIPPPTTPPANKAPTIAKAGLEPSDCPGVEIFKSFRVSMTDSTEKILPAALKKYNINAPTHLYALYIVTGDKERCMGPDEKPLILFKQLDKEGKKPMFMLRRIAPPSPASMAVSPEPVAGGLM